MDQKKKLKIKNEKIACTYNKLFYGYWNLYINKKINFIDIQIKYNNIK